MVLIKNKRYFHIDFYVVFLIFENNASRYRAVPLTFFSTKIDALITIKKPKKPNSYIKHVYYSLVSRRNCANQDF